MEKRDARTLSQEAQEEVRRQAIKQLETGKSQAAVARDLDVSRAAVRELIQEGYGIDYALQSLSAILRRWGFTPQRPLKKAYEQRPAEVKKWLKETYPLVEEKAKAEKAEIWWGG